MLLAVVERLPPKEIEITMVPVGLPTVSVQVGPNNPKLLSATVSVSMNSRAVSPAVDWASIVPLSVKVVRKMKSGTTQSEIQQVVVQKEAFADEIQGQFEVLRGLQPLGAMHGIWAFVGADGKFYFSPPTTSGLPDGILPQDTERSVNALISQLNAGPERFLATELVFVRSEPEDQPIASGDIGLMTSAAKAFPAGFTMRGLTVPPPRPKDATDFVFLRTLPPF